MLDKTVSKFREAVADWSGEDHYKTAKVEPIDLIQACGILKQFACGCVIKYAARIAETKDPEKIKRDLKKAEHYLGFVWEDLEENSG